MNKFDNLLFMSGRIRKVLRLFSPLPIPPNSVPCPMLFAFLLPIECPVPVGVLIPFTPPLVILFVVAPFIVILKFRMGVEGIGIGGAAIPASRIPGISNCGGDNKKDEWNDVLFPPPSAVPQSSPSVVELLIELLLELLLLLIGIGVDGGIDGGGWSAMVVTEVVVLDEEADEWLVGNCGVDKPVGNGVVVEVAVVVAPFLLFLAVVTDD